ncbi:hypothetical protein ACFOGI_13025 [Virgibacillus xinjiangensis]|uniref:Uncharacterized protein n=1 Tax=Virgibacillus xinjiangensis TaxID=393090 RepID=A0ABV7CXG3_9BACI
MAQEKKGPNNQFKEEQHHGEHRNGRKSPYKNSSVHGDEGMDQYISRKEE